MGVEITAGLLTAGLLLVLAEILVPGGVLGVIGGIFLFAGIVCAFLRGPAFGFAALVGTIVFGSVGFILWLKYFPKTPVGKHMILQGDARTWGGYDESGKQYLHKEGIAQTPLHPTGIAKIESARVDVVTRGELIEADTPVQVIAVEGNRIVVRRMNKENKAEKNESELRS